MKCGKTCYAGRNEALVAISKIYKRRDGASKVERSVYWCKRCEAFHLTCTYKTDNERHRLRINRELSR